MRHRLCYGRDLHSFPVRIVPLVLLLLPAAPPLSDQAVIGGESTPVQRIRAEAEDFLDRRVRVTGGVVGHPDEGERETSAYFLQDDAGEELRVVTMGNLPPLDSRWTVTGMVVLDRRGDPYMVEVVRVQDGSGGEGAEDTPSNVRALWLGLLLLLLGLLYLWRRVRLANRADPPLIFAPRPTDSGGRVRPGGATARGK